VNDEKEIISKATVMASFTSSFQHSPGGTYENHGKFQSLWSVCQPRFKADTSQQKHTVLPLYLSDQCLSVIINKKERQLIYRKL
jgi:hypothetical protein